MKTQIVIKKGWVVITEYDFVFTLTKEDTVNFKDIEYRVEYCFLDIDENRMIILVKE